MRHLKTFLLAGSAAFVLALVADVHPAQADRTVSASEPVVWFDDVRGTAKEIIFPESDDSKGKGNDDNRSGLGDGTNPGMGDGTANSPNEGTDNPNKAPASRGPGK